MDDLAKKKEQRYLFLKQLYDETDGNEHVFLSPVTVGVKIGLDERTVRKVVQYLVGEGLMNSHARDVVNISHFGVIQVEQAMEKPEDPTQYFPPITNMNIILEGTTIHGDFNVASSIQGSYNKVASADAPDNLKDLLKQLAKEVAQISEHLPTEVAEQVVRDLDSLTAEAISKKPREQWWHLSIEGIKKAARDVGEIGKSVIELASAIVAILSARQ